MSDPQHTEATIKVDTPSNAGNEAAKPAEAPKEPAPTANENPGAERSGNEGGDAK